MTQVTSQGALRRPCCAVCRRPEKNCLCAWVTTIQHDVEVLILQHPLEVGNPKGSARLLQLCLPHSRMVTGETFVEPAFLRTSFAGRAAGENPRHTVLLYPDTPQDQAPDLTAPPALDPNWLRDPARLRLIVLDGTWRKSRKMLYRSPPLQQLPRLSLHGLPASNYRLRQAHQAHQLSTLEATCAALMQLEANVEKFQPLLSAFDGFVNQQLAYGPGPVRPAPD